MCYPTISVIVPVYNVEKYLPACLDSLISQTYPCLEIVLVDDGSTDSSASICDHYSKLDNRFVVIHKTNGGLSSARNAGLKQASGSLIGFVDSDDWVEPDMYSELYKSIEENDSDISVCGLIREYSNKSIPENIKAETYTSKEALKLLLAGINLHDHSWSKLYKKELFKNVSFPEGKIYEDVRTTYLLFLESQKVSTVSKCLYHYRQRKGSIIRSDFSFKQFELLEAIREIKSSPKIDDSLSAILERREIHVECYLFRELLQIEGKYPEQLKLAKQYLKNSIHENRLLIINDNMIPKSYRLMALNTWLFELIFTNSVFRRYLKRKYQYYS